MRGSSQLFGQRLHIFQAFSKRDERVTLAAARAEGCRLIGPHVSASRPRISWEDARRNLWLQENNPRARVPDHFDACALTTQHAATKRTTFPRTCGSNAGRTASMIRPRI